MPARTRKPDDALPIDAGDHAHVLVKVHRIWQGAAGDIERVTVVMPNGNLETFPYDPRSIEKVETARVFRN